MTNAKWHLDLLEDTYFSIIQPLQVVRLGMFHGWKSQFFYHEQTRDIGVALTIYDEPTHFVFDVTMHVEDVLMLRDFIFILNMSS